MSTNSTFEYTVNYGGTMDAYITLRNKHAATLELALAEVFKQSNVHRLVG